MKYKRWVPQALILLGIYICGLVLGCAAICCLPQYLDRAKFQDSARQAAEAFAAGGSTLVQGWSDVSVLVFDEAGELIYQRTGAPHLPWMNYEDYARGHVHRALRSGDYFGVIFVPRSREEAASGQWLGAVGVFTLFGSRFTLADGRAAVLFEVKCEMARFIIIEQFLWVYSVSMLVIACFFYISYRKWRKLGELERDYVDNITHELKSPIASIKALAMALSEHDLSQEEQSLYYGLILREAGRQEAMVSSILNLSRLQSRGAPVEKSVVTASELFTQRIEDYAAMCDGMDIEFEASPELMSLPEMYTSKRLIWQLMDILVDNAVKFVGESGRVSMGARHSEDRATIWVRDNGIGIEKEELEKIFLRFYRINRSDRIAGNGLGLAIAREICCALGEKLWVESRPGEGSVFYFTVRLRG